MACIQSVSSILVFVKLSASACINKLVLRALVSYRCNEYARGGNLRHEVSKDHTLRYRRGQDGAKVMATDHAREALDGAYGTGKEETLATLMQLATMDCKVCGLDMYPVFTSLDASKM